MTFFLLRPSVRTFNIYIQLQDTYLGTYLHYPINVLVAVNNTY